MKLIPEKDMPELQRDLESRYWYVRKKKKGHKPLFKTTGEKRSKHRAKKRALEIIAEWLGVEHAGEKISFKSVGEEVILLKASKSRATQESARLHIQKHLGPTFGSMTVADSKKNPLVNEATFEQYVSDQRFMNPKRRLFNDWKHFRMVMNHAWKKGLISRKVIVKNPDPKTKAGRVYSDREVRRLIKAANPTLRAQITAGVTMGMRRGEILCLTWDRHADMKRRMIRLYAEDTKIRRGREFAMSDDFFDLADKIHRRQRRPRTGPVFPSRYDRKLPTRSNKSAWRACKRRAGVVGRFHDLRHTFLTNALLRDGANPMHVSVYAGVSMTEIQRTYLHPRAEDTRGVARSLPKARSKGVKMGEEE